VAAKLARRRTVSGYPSVVSRGTSGPLELSPIAADGPGLRLAPISIADSDGTFSVPSASSFAFRQLGQFRATLLVVDIPDSVDATLYLNNSKFVVVTDRQGLDMAFPLGNPDGSSYMDLNEARIEGFNAASGVRDVRCWLQVIA